MSAPVGTRIEASDGVVFTKTGEGAWQHSEEDAPKTALDGAVYGMAIEGFEEAATNPQAKMIYELMGYTVKLPAQEAAS